MTDFAFPDPAAWGPTTSGHHHVPWGRRFLLLFAAVGIGLLVAGGTTALLLFQQFQRNLTRVEVTGLSESVTGAPLHVLVAGSDARDGMTPADVQRLNLGRFGGERSDTVMLVTVTADRKGVNVVSFPRDLRVDDDGTIRKLTETFAFGGPDNLVQTVRDNFGIEVNHYAQIGILGFVNAVDTLGSVEICLEENLFDRKSGASFAAGCHDMDGAAALSYVRSRSGAGSDFSRIDRQQNFLRSVLRELVTRQVLLDVPKLFQLVEDLASQVTTDDSLGLNEMLRLAEQLRGLANGEVPMTNVPGYVQTVDGKSFVIAYGPGTRSLFSQLQRGELLAPRGSRTERNEVNVATWSGGHAEGRRIVISTLQWAGYNVSSAGEGPFDIGETTTVFIVPGHEREAEWVGAMLGAPVQRLPVNATPPAGAEVVVAVGLDAVS
ncbi:MAG: LCP family protein [Nitriliruptorales bacterium]|nr:LCP family protein [Nitriliruptorales bacterium]